MEGRVPLSVRARTIAEETQLKQQKAYEEKEKQDALKAGNNPIMTDAFVLELCLIFLEGKILDAASQGANSVVIPYTDIVPLKERYDCVVLISASLAKKELQRGADYIKEQFKRKHADFNAESYRDRASIVHIFGDKFKIEF